MDHNLIISVDKPKVCYGEFINSIMLNQSEKGLHASAVISDEAVIEKGVTIGANTVVGRCYISSGTTIGSNSTIGDNTTIGLNAIIGSNTCIGGEGFGYYKHNGMNKRFPMLESGY